MKVILPRGKYWQFFFCKVKKAQTERNVCCIILKEVVDKTGKCYGTGAYNLSIK